MIWNENLLGKRIWACKDTEKKWHKQLEVKTEHLALLAQGSPQVTTHSELASYLDVPAIEKAPAAEKMLQFLPS